MNTAASEPTHRMHFVGDLRCAAEGCEPAVDVGYLTEPVEVTKAKLDAEARRPMIARRPSR